MTSEEYDKLTDEEKQVIIAKLTKINPKEFVKKYYERNIPFPQDRVIRLAVYEPCPDYLNDLNAMHEAEETMSWQQKQAYGEALGGGHTGSDSELNDCFTAAHATAAQRAKAFVLAMTANLKENK